MANLEAGAQLRSALFVEFDNIYTSLSRPAGERRPTDSRSAPTSGSPGSSDPHAQPWSIVLGPIPRKLCQSDSPDVGVSLP